MRIAKLNPQSGRVEVFSPSGEFAETLHDEAAEVAVRFDGDDETEKDELGSFDIVAYTGVPVDRWWGKMIIDVKGIEHEKQTTLLLEHRDEIPLGVCTKHKRSDEGLRLSGHFLGKEASPEAHRLRAQCREQAPGKPGIKLKSSIGVCFKKYRFLEKGDEVEVNGRKLKYTDKHDTLVVEKSFLFENSVIYVNPADRGTSAEVMHGERAMKDLTPATSAQLAASQSTPPPAVQPAAQVVRFSDLSDAEKRAVLAEGQREIESQRLAFATAFPDPIDAEWRERQRLDGRTVEQAKIQRFDESQVVHAQARLEAKAREEVTAQLSAISGRDGRGFDSATAPRAPAAVEVGRQFATTRIAEELLHKNPAAVALFGHSALERMTRALQLDERQIAGFLDESFPMPTQDAIDEAARALLAGTPREKLVVMERFSSGGSGGHAAMDLAQITVKGFIDQFHNSMMKERAWGVRLCQMLESNQETEIVRWLDYHPQLQPFNSSPEEQLVQTRQIQFTSIWYESTIGLDVQDFMLQKFGKIDQLMGQAGAVHARHWNKLVATQIEANNKGYDSSLLFDKTHTLGGKAPANQVNDLSAANGQIFCQVGNVGNVSPSDLNSVLFQAAPFLRNYFAANGEPMNEEENREVCVLVPEKFSAAAEAAVYSNRLDGYPGGAGGGRDNPIKVESERRGDKWEVVSSPRLATAAGHTTDTYVYMFLLGNDRKPILRAEPIGLQLHFSGPGSEVHRKQNKYAFWSRGMRSTAPGAWTSALRIKLTSA